MGIIYILQFFWIFVFGLLIVSTFILTVFWKMCVSTQVQDYHQCIDLTQFSKYTTSINTLMLHLINSMLNSCYEYKIKFYVLDFLFPQSTRIEYLKICEIREIKFFCRDFVEKSEFMFMMATFGVILILISLVRTIF